MKIKLFGLVVLALSGTIFLNGCTENSRPSRNATAPSIVRTSQRKFYLGINANITKKTRMGRMDRII